MCYTALCIGKQVYIDVTGYIMCSIDLKIALFVYYYIPINIIIMYFQAFGLEYAKGQRAV